jgi:hypothetical protein
VRQRVADGLLQRLAGVRGHAVPHLPPSQRRSRSETN